MCKIDVEGFEGEVIKGLSKSIKMISFEFTPTPGLIKKSIKSVEYLSGIGDVKFNYSFGETMSFALDEWVTSNEIREIILSIPSKTSFSGDIYAKFTN